MTSQAVDGKQGGVKIVEQNCNWCVILNGINDYVGRRTASVPTGPLMA